MDESEIIEFGRVRDGVAKSAEAEAAMTPLGESALTLGVDALSVVEKQRPKVWTISAITIRRAHRKFC